MASTDQPDCQERADCAERMLDMTVRHDNKAIADVLDAIGEAETKRGEDMMRYTNAAKEFFKEMRDL